MKRVITGSLMAFLLFILISPAGQAQGTINDYERAGNLEKLLSGRVWHSDINASWVGKRNMILYEERTPDGKEFMLADAEGRKLRKAFDATRLAQALSRLTGDTINAADLPVRYLLMADDLASVTFEYSGWVYKCGLRRYTLVREREARKPNFTTADERWPWGFRDELANKPDTSPDKKMIAFIRDYNLWISKPEENKEYQLSNDGGIGRYYSSYTRWSPDSKKIMAYKVLPAEKHMINYIESSPEKQVQPLYYSYEYPKPGDAVPQFFPQIFDVIERKHIEVDDALIANQYTINNFRWDSAGTSLTFEYNRRSHQIYRVMRIDAVTGKMSVVIDEQSPTFIHYSGKRYRHDVNSTGEIIWASERDGWNHLWLYDGTNGRVKNQITTGEWVIRDVVSIDEKERTIIFGASGREKGDPYLIHYYRIGFDGGGMIHLTPGDGNHEVLFSHDGHFFLDTWSRVDMPPESVIRSARDGSVVMPLAKADITGLLSAGWQYPEVFSAKGRDGTTDIWGIIIRPLNFDPSRSYPVIEYIYAGPHNSFVPKSFSVLHRDLNKLAELGFIVVQIDGMGTSNRSKKFHDVAWKNLGDAGFPDRILWMKAAAEKYPYMNLEKVGIYGTSAGGQNSTGALLFHPEFYDVAVSSCGCHDNRMDKIWWNEQWMGWPVDQSYIESSNVENAWRLKGRLLLINGEMDKNVDPASTTQLVNALIKAEKDFDYLLVPGMGHSNGGKYGDRRRMDFFVEHLLEVKPPEWNKK